MNISSIQAVVILVVAYLALPRLRVAWLKRRLRAWWPHLSTEHRWAVLYRAHVLTGGKYWPYPSLSSEQIDDWFNGMLDLSTWDGVRKGVFLLEAYLHIVKDQFTGQEWEFTPKGAMSTPHTLRAAEAQEAREQAVHEREQRWLAEHKERIARRRPRS